MGRGDALSVVMPSWREGRRLLGSLQAVRVGAPHAECVVAAFEEPGDVRAAALAAGAVWVDCPRACRGEQLALGAARARGDALLFVHADTRLPAGADALVRAVLARPGVVGGAFRLRFDRAHPLLDALAALSALGHPAPFLGDQGIFCTRVGYDAAGGVPPLPLFEDVEFTRRLARVGRLVRLPQSVTTSARRFERHGPARQIARNALLMAAYRAGVPPARLHRWYSPDVTGGGAA